MKFTYEMAQDLRDKAFTDSERAILNFVEGTCYIDIADQLMSVYEGYDIAYSYRTFFNKFLKRKNQVKWILEKIRVKNEELDNLMNPKKFNKEYTSFASSNTNLVNDFESKNTARDTTGAFSYDFSESSAQAKATSLIKGASTQTSQKNTDLENKFSKSPTIDVSTQLVGKKQFDPNKVLQEDKILDVKEAHYEMIPEERSPVEELGKEVFSNINLGVTGSANSNYAASNAETLSLTRTDGVADSTSNTYSNTDYVVHKDSSGGVYNTQVLQVLRMQIPQLMDDFYGSFFDLFRKSRL